MKILVTGGAGFIGSHLCRRLLADGHEVVCLDNFYTSTRENIAELLTSKKFILVERDATLPFDIPADQIFNLACPASPKHYQRNPVETIRTNVLGMINVLENAKKYHAAVLQASTSEIYGDPLEHPQTETYFGNVDPLSVRACYDEGKRCAETLCMDYHREYQVDIRIVRIFNTYGPNMALDDGRVVSNFIIQALSGKDVMIYGTGDQTRSFCYVSDMIEGLVLMMSGQEIGPVNLGNPVEFKIVDIARKVIDFCGSKSQIKFVEPAKSDPQKRRPDIRLAQRTLNWSPKVDFEEGLRLTIPYFRKTLGL